MTPRCPSQTTSVLDAPEAAFVNAARRRLDIFYDTGFEAGGLDVNVGELQGAMPSDGTVRVVAAVRGLPVKGGQRQTKR